MPDWIDQTLGWLGDVLPFALGVVGVLLLVSLLDGQRRPHPQERDGDPGRQQSNGEPPPPRRDRSDP